MDLDSCAYMWLSWNSSRLEGNTYSLLDTKAISRATGLRRPNSPHGGKFGAQRDREILLHG
jgi:hypothetical protein